MASLNKVLIMGNLTRDPEVRHTPSGKAVCDITVAINHTWKDQNGQKQEDTTFVDATLWGRTAELAGQYLSKGRGVFLEGRLQLEQWEDKDTGKKRSRLKIVGDTMQFLPSGQRSTEGQQGTPPSARSTPASASASATATGTQHPADDDDIPF